jgi:putative lipoprotein
MKNKTNHSITHRQKSKQQINIEKTMRKLTFKSRILSLAVLCGLTLALASCTNEDIAQNGNQTDNEKNLTIFSTGETPATRTSMESNGIFYWEAGDKIWVKDDNGTWQQSSNSPTNRTASFKFKVPGKFTKGSTYKVYYPGQNGSQNQVTIAASQSQTEPNTTTHFGTSGDCGIADAAWSNIENGFTFTLDHKASYLLFLLRASNFSLYDCYLTKIEVISDNDIASTYTLDQTSGKLIGGGSGNQIVLTTKNPNPGTANYNGFPLNNRITSAATNGAYMVIKPGTHNLKVRYWVKDIATGTEGYITKILGSKNYDQNKYYNITANLDINNYSGNNYYMWDAQKPYWYGYEWYHLQNGWQPILPNGKTGTGTSTSAFYPKSKTTDPLRWYNGTFPGYHKSNSATTTLFQTLPNANELSWYTMKGDPHWDDDILWTTMGHLYKGGMWLKKKSVLQSEGNYNTERSADGVTDLRITYKYYNNVASFSPLSATEINKYFFLPTLGGYTGSMFFGTGVYGYYWSSSAFSEESGHEAYALQITRGEVYVYQNGGRGTGMIVQAFE